MNKHLRTLLLVLVTVAVLTAPVIAEVSYEDAYAFVMDVDVPATVAPGETFEVIVSIEANLPDETNVEIGIYDPETWDTLVDYFDVITGYEEASYAFELEAPDVEGDFEVVADVYFEIDGEYLYVEGSETYFTVTVQADGGGLGIPGFPFYALFLGLGLTALMLQNTKKTHI